MKKMKVLPLLCAVMTLLYSCKAIHDDIEPSLANPHLLLYNTDPFLRAVGNEGTTLIVTGKDDGSDQTWTRKATLHNNEWVLDSPFEIKQSGRIIGIAADADISTNEYGAVRLSVDPANEREVVITTAKYSPTEHRLHLTFRQLQCRFKVKFDLSDYDGAKHMQNIRLYGVPKLAFLKMDNGMLTRVENFDPVDYPIEETADGDFEFTFYTYPGEDNLIPSLTLTMDGRYFKVSLMSAEKKKWEVGKTYRYDVKVTDQLMIEEVKNSDDDRMTDMIQVMPPADAPYFRASVTNLRWKVIPRNHASLIGVFVDNYNGEQFDGDIRLTLQDATGKIYQQGAYWSNFIIGSYSYEGLRVPFLVNVPAGRYKLQPLLRLRGEQEWFAPFVADDSDTEEDWWVDVKDTPQVFLTYTGIDGKMITEASVTPLKWNKAYTYTLEYNSYEQKPQTAKVRLYYERDPKMSGHSAYRDPDGGLDVWKELLSEQAITLPVQGKGKVELPFTITSHHENHLRFAGYLYTTIQVNNGEETPIQVEANKLYNISLGVKNVVDEGASLARFTTSYTLTSAGNIIVEK